MLQNLVILVVDDTTLSRVGTAIIVQSLGFGADVAASGSSALSKLEKMNFAAILMDLDMPDMDGLECTRKIRAYEIISGGRVPIIGFSSSVAADVQRQCIQAGMDAFLHRECPLECLKATLLELIPPSVPR